MKRTSTGHPRTARTPENVESVRRSVIESPRCSTRRRASILGLPRRLLQRILHGELNFHPYKIMIVQKLLPSDFVQRRPFCERMLEITASDDVILMMSDEAHFHLDGYLNKQNCPFWAAKNPWELHQRPLHTAKVSVWCGISKVGIVGPYFFEEEGATVTVTSERYVEMLRNFLCPQLRSLWVNMEEMWFQQDGATAHTARASMTVVRQMFLQHVVSHFGDVPWPPRSPDLSAWDFFLWGYLKSKLYVWKPCTVDDLKVSIREEIATVPQEMLVNVMQNFEERLQTCVRQGRHLSDIIFRNWVINVSNQNCIYYRLFWC